MKWVWLFSLIFSSSLLFSQQQKKIFYNAPADINIHAGFNYPFRAVIRGSISRIIEIRKFQFNSKNKSAELTDLPSDTIYFDKKGHVVNYVLPIDFLTRNTYDSKYFDKYHLSKKSSDNFGVDTSGEKIIDKFDIYGNKKMVLGKLKNGELWEYESFKRDRSTGLVTEFTTYRTKDTIKIREKYKYNKNQHLIKVTDYLPNGNLDEEITFNYISFDRKGNWTKRIETRRSRFKKPLEKIITQRILSYYN